MSQSIKKNAFSIAVILYSVISLFWCYVILNNLPYSFSLISAGKNSIGIIGGTGLPTFMFELGNIVPIVASILFMLASIASAALLTVSAFKKQTNRKSSVLLCVLLTLSLISFMFIPVQSYVVSLYIVAQKVPFASHLQIIYIVLSLSLVIKNIMSAARSNKKSTV
ncbi:MAG: hypothetical protein IJY33_02585 [Oscillospiraceae bacterium]|nr:hypothetical protein [Oscillospiraceae bacterium]